MSMYFFRGLKIRFFFFDSHHFIQQKLVFIENPLII